MSDQELLTALRAALGKHRKGDGGIASQVRAAAALRIDHRRVSEIQNRQRQMEPAIRKRAERLLAK